MLHNFQVDLDEVSKRKWFMVIFAVLLLFLIGIFILFLEANELAQPNDTQPVKKNTNQILKSEQKTIVVPQVQPEIKSPGIRATVTIPVHYFQSFNNCGPASLAMMLSHFGIYQTQQELGEELRPYQITTGDNDDKSVTLEELAQKATELGLVAYHRPAGDIDLLRKLIANDLPILTRTWTQVDEDIGHYRVVKGYDDERQVLIQDDSLQGKDLSFSYHDFSTMWEKFGYEYVVLVEEDRIAVVEAILGDEFDEVVAWQHAREEAIVRLKENQDDIYARFNLSVILYELGEYQESVRQFELIEDRLPKRTLWYQVEPLLAYQELKLYDQLLPKIEAILENGNRAYSELYQIRGEIYLEQGANEAAREEFELAVRYNENYEPAQEALSAL